MSLYPKGALGFSFLLEEMNNLQFSKAIKFNPLLKSGF
jgi:hypothetical protein